MLPVGAAQTLVLTSEGMELKLEVAAVLQRLLLQPDMVMGSAAKGHEKMNTSIPSMF